MSVIIYSHKSDAIRENHFHIPLPLLEMTCLKIMFAPEHQVAEVIAIADASWERFKVIKCRRERLTMVSRDKMKQLVLDYADERGREEYLPLLVPTTVFGILFGDLMNVVRSQSAKKFLGHLHPKRIISRFAPQRSKLLQVKPTVEEKIIKRHEP